MTSPVPFKTNLCVSVDCSYLDENDKQCSSSGSEYHNVLFRSKEEYLKCAEENSVENMFCNIIESIKQSVLEHYETEGKVLNVKCEFRHVCTELDENFEPFEKSDFDTVVLEIIDDVLHVS